MKPLFRTLASFFFTVTLAYSTLYSMNDKSEKKLFKESEQKLTKKYGRLPTPIQARKRSSSNKKYFDSADHEIRKEWTKQRLNKRPSIPDTWKEKQSHDKNPKS